MNLKAVEAEQVGWRSKRQPRQALAWSVHHYHQMLKMVSYSLPVLMMLERLGQN